MDNPDTFFPHGDQIAIHLANVRKSYGEGESLTRVLRSLDLDVRVGEMMLLVGPSGCGKTTLLSIVSGNLRAEGDVHVLGRDIGNATEEERTDFRGRNIGFLFQQFNLIPSLTSLENVAMPLLINGRGMRESMHMAETALDDVGLLHRGKTRPPKLSGGEQQRVAIARALVRHPSLVLCDEPTSSLDSENGVIVMNLLREAANEPGRTVVVVTHDSRIYHFADRMAVMEDGRIQRVLEKADLDSVARMQI